MALPTLTAVPDCANFTLTVQPFLSQFISLPPQIFEAGRDFESLKNIYVNTNPLVTAVAFSLLLVPLLLIVSEINRNYSQIDRLWSILPSVYNGHYVLWSYLNGVSTDRTWTIFVCTLIWSARLTYNYWRKGGYSIGSEDYRWTIVREKINNGFLWFLFNIFFISLTQSLLLLMITAPTYVFLVLNTVGTAPAFGLPDLAFSRGMIFFIIIEYFADQQQWDFQKAKQSYQQTARVPTEYKSTFSADDLNRGFVISGLWSWCRHPNFAAEQAVWLMLYAWSCYATQTYINWSGAGVLAYILLFQGSTILTESISASKYPEYDDYQYLVGKFIPIPWLGSGHKAMSKKKKTSHKQKSEKKTE
ncbi:uncharacterized protein CIMG_01797 [Coccidioides immitis RS]|uniref:DUF1295 domain-containing protein n=3 Tax=Coccidioides immitis TaxID=5501 RepID=A0A0E1RYP8_COCIM|nr:uncharacterized protein CIMG_01797 [Coccidioides immitis RS]EAS36443.1 hypothetical protein CIMG_01797 [Coccidioides immitis RS]KMP01801.1 steroid oxidoreductase superfamily protein [Coccidioides immitis RMSCC 2394]KMU88110.1 steroid oxidoreductase superfamily protein [Coccidioides immitis H538.4]TPX25432.1 hypothetical protein DIZ76_010887 [Coccidioides immitis]